MKPIPENLPPSLPGPAEREHALVHLWQIGLDLPDDEVTRLAGELSPEERQRAARFYFARDRRRFTVAHAALRRILAGYLDCAPARLEFALEQRNKPVLAAPHAALHFNLAHSGEMALLAVTRQGDIGVDVEQIHPLEDLLQLAERNFSPRERAALQGLPPGQQELAFFEIWTRKEAFIKAIGEGLYYPLNAFDVSLGQAACLESILGQPATGWNLQAFAPAPGYVGAVVVHSPAARLIFYSWASTLLNSQPLSSAEERL